MAFYVIATWTDKDKDVCVKENFLKMEDARFVCWWEWSRRDEEIDDVARERGCLQAVSSSKEEGIELSGRLALNLPMGV